VRHHQPTTTVAILDSDTVLGRALCALLEGDGYRTILLHFHPKGIVDEQLDGADLLLLAPRLDEGAREAFVGAMGKSTLQRARTPVIVLSADTEEDLLAEGIIWVPWPCETRVLVERIEASLLEAPPPKPLITPQPAEAVTQE
jgi:DNA-binding response OmpR family regulator